VEARYPGITLSRGFLVVVTCDEDKDRNVTNSGVNPPCRVLTVALSVSAISGVAQAPITASPITFVHISEFQLHRLSRLRYPV
jgi:hypothetical protein